MKTTLRFIVIVILWCSLPLYAQTFRGGVQGTVKDEGGAPLADVTITATNTETGLSRTAKTGSAGTYFVSELPIGSYSIKAEKSQFQPQTQQAVKVAISLSARVDFRLSMGEAAEPAEHRVVEMMEPLIYTTTDKLGGTLDATGFQDLPVNGRDFMKLLLLTPGAGGDASMESDAAGSFGLFTVSGNRGRSNNYLIDGTDMNDGYRNLPAINEFGVFGVPATILPLDALREISVTNNTEAEFGRSSGATVDIVTKSGTNNLHGSLYEYFRNSALDARNFFNTSEQPQDVFHNNQYGFTLGGPVVRDRTFWFVSYEGQRERVGFPALARVPTSAEMSQAIANNGGIINPVIASLLSHGAWPSSNRAPDSQGNNLITSTQAPDRTDNVIAKMDQRFGETDFLSGRYFFGNSDQSAPLALVGGGILPGFNTVAPTNVNIASISYTHIFGMHLLTEIRGGYNRFSEDALPEDRSFNPASIGLNMGTSQRDSGLPSISVNNFAILGANSSVPRGRVDTNWQFFDNFTYSAGSHNWKFGYEFRRTSVDGFFDNGYRGQLAFATLDDFIAGTPASGRQAQGNSSRSTFQNSHALYAQDKFSLLSNLTVNYGVRWEYFGVLGEAQHRFSILDPGGNLHLVNQLYPRDLNNFAPRAGFAWDIRGNAKTMVRGGWGVYYDAFSQDLFTGQLPFNTFNSGPAYNGVGPNPITFSFSPAAVIQPGVQVFGPATFGAADVFTVNQNLRTPHMQIYNLNAERELAKNIALQVGYVGSVGRKLFRFLDINQFNPVSGSRAFPSFGIVNELQSSANSHYDSLEVTLRLRGWHRLTSAMNYTWSHSTDNASDGQDFVPNASQPDNSFRPDLEWANSNFDMRHRFTWSFSYDVPEYKKMHALTSGWGISGVLMLSAGQPFNVNYLFEGDFNGSGEFLGRPDLVGNPFAGTHSPGQFLNLSAFQVPCTVDSSGNCLAGTQHFGSLGRNAFVGPAIQNFDLSLAKTNNINERLKMQFRLDIFNPFNHPNFANPMEPNFALDFLQNGMGANGQGVGFLPLKVTPDVGVGNPFMAAGGPRNIELALRFIF